MLLSTLLVAGAFAASPLGDRVGHGAQVIWAGLDYSTTEVFVPETFSDPNEKVFWSPGGGLDDRITRFASPAEAWIALTTDWNTMFLSGLYKKIEKELDVDLVAQLPEADGQTQPRMADWFQAASLATEHPPSFTVADVATRVNGWKLTSSTGTGLGFIVERLSKNEDKGCAWPVFFDVASREVLYTERLCDGPSGMEFRNYWFNPLVDITKAMLARV